jgi:hypothetical protein
MHVLRDGRPVNQFGYAKILALPAYNDIGILKKRAG